MLTVLLIALIILYLFLLLSAIGIMYVFQIIMRRRLHARSKLLETASNSEFPASKTAVILSVRGADPLLGRCIEGLCRLNHPNYELFFVLDHEKDPAADVLKNVLKNVQESIPSEKIHLEILQNPLKTCSLKCSALIQVLSRLDDSFELAAFIDGDTIPFPEWLNELTRPFCDPKTDFVTGYRWFVPASGNVGSYMRYFWNLASFVQMFLFHVLWGGSFAVRTASIARIGMLENLAQSLVEDTSSSKLCARNGGRLVFAPCVLTACRERCSIRFAHRWCARQMLWVKLYLPGIWMLVLLTFVLFLLISTASLWAFVLGIVHQNLSEIMLSLLGPCMFWGGIALLFPFVERTVRQNIAVFQEPVHWRKSSIFAILCAIPLAAASFFLGILQVLFTRQISWRGIDYRIKSHGKVERLNYAPYSKPNSSPSESRNESIW